MGKWTIRLLLCACAGTSILLGGCSSAPIVFVYPDEDLASRLQSLGTPALYLDSVRDLRPAVQREGEGRFFKITYPSDAAWEVSPTLIYAEALAQDLEQTGMFELVPLRGQAEYVLSVELLSLSCRLERSPASFLLTGALGAGLGMALGDDGSDRAKLAVALGVVSILAVPVPTDNRAEAEVRLVMRNAAGEVVWEKACLGEFAARKFMTPTARQDQELVNEHLTRAVKRANACLLGQLRQFLLENAGQTG